MKSRLLLMIVLFAGCKRRNAEPETFLIDYGQTGRVTVFFNEKNGQEPKYQNGRRVYIISGERTLTKFQSNDGFLDQRFYYIDKDGKRKEILLDSTHLYYDRPDLKDRFRLNHFGDTIITVWGIAGKMGEKRYLQFVIGTYENPGSIDTTAN